MKKLILALAGALLLSTAVNAQTNVPPTTIPTFFDSVRDYFFAFNTNLATFRDGDKFDFRIGTANVNNHSLLATFGGGYNVWKSLSIEAEIHNVSITSGIAGYEAGAGWSFVKYDTKLTAYLHVGYETDLRRSYILPGIRVEKALTLNTYAGVSLGVPFHFSRGDLSSGPTIGVFTGFRF